MADNETLEAPATTVVTEQPVQEPIDINSPVEPMDVRLNFNSMLYVFTELVGLFNRQSEILNAKGILSDEDVQKIYEVTADKKALSKVYNAVFHRFMEHYYAVKQKVTGMTLEEMGVSFGPRAENSATEETDTSEGKKQND